MTKQKLIVIAGPTATGKSDHAVELALKVNGEIISADSRQIYRGMDLGTGKITVAEMRGIPHHLLDVRDPHENFSVQEYKELADAAIADIVAREKTPILCGGTGFFIQAVIDNVTLPQVPPNPELRTKLETLSNEELFNQLQKMDPDRAETIDPDNKRRIIRALEIATALGHVPKQEMEESLYDLEIIYLDKLDDELHERIEKRLIDRLEKGMIEEVKQLNEKGISWQRLENFGLEYRFIAEFLQDKISHNEMIESIKTKSWQYAKRQRTWFKKYLIK
ncbi:MAG: tRNA (adenosine(37)-N6)-dimethylallyltransferase MiaA [Candidatus Pacebacteria bacterium]|nr:tRNA (adenosine(37)-N6)-dimethylallyltransferase MiaA [Candidatus Paceibacterota bacterium]